ncbi:MAG: four helix bundle protein [Xenophilus sp.]
MARIDELSIYQDGCALLSLAVDVQTQMPRAYKRSVGDHIHDLCAAMLEDMAMANAGRGAERVAQIERLLTRLRAVTAMLRVRHDKRLINTKVWAHASQASHGHTDQARIARALLKRGHAVDGDLSRTFRKRA